MTMILAAPRGITQGIGLTQTPDFSLIKDPTCAGVLWHRHTLPDFQDWIDTLPAETLPSARMILRPENVLNAMSEVCDIHDLPKGPHLQRLIEDITALAHIFTKTMGAPFLRVRLDLVTTNACRKFHIDALTARLVCTYRGTGTQYGTGAKGTVPSRIFTVPTGSPIVLRGTAWPEQPCANLLHRSPPIEGTGETRLVLVIDPISDPNTV